MEVDGGFVVAEQTHEQSPRDQTNKHTNFLTATMKHKHKRNYKRDGRFTVLVCAKWCSEVSMPKNGTPKRHYMVQGVVLS